MELHDRPEPYVGQTSETLEEASKGGCELPPPDLFDPVIEAYKKDIDRTLLRENLRRSVAERLARFQNFMNSVSQMRGAALPADLRQKLLNKR